MKIDDKTKELIAIGVSVAVHCQPCLEYHLAKARDAGACENGIADAIAVAKMVRKGAMSKMDKFAATVLSRPPADVGPDEDCSRL